MILIPAPKKLKLNQGEFNFPSKLFISIPTKSLLTSAKMLKKNLKILVLNHSSVFIMVKKQLLKVK